MIQLQNDESKKGSYKLPLKLIKINRYFITTLVVISFLLSATRTT